jgi:hypothetical protein
MAKTDLSLEVRALLDEVRSFRAEDISHSELGTANGFQEAEAVKNYGCDFFINILEIALNTGAGVTLTVLGQGLNTISSEIGAFRSITREIGRLAGQGVHTAQFPDIRQKEIANFQDHVRQAQLALQPLESALRLAKMEQQLPDLRALEAELRKTQVEITAQFNQAAVTSADAEKILNNLRDRVMSRGVEEAQANFAALRQNHTLNQKLWFIAFVVLAATTLAAVIYVGFVGLIPLPPYLLAAMIVRRILLISTPAVFMQIALSKFSLERNLRIIYDHRETVLAQYRNFESAIGDDAPSKQQLRLEIAKYIFSDPVTGYIAAAAASEVTINPVVGMIERVVTANRGTP